MKLDHELTQRAAQLEAAQAKWQQVQEIESQRLDEGRRGFITEQARQQEEWVALRDAQKKEMQAQQLRLEEQSRQLEARLNQISEDESGGRWFGKSQWVEIVRGINDLQSEQAELEHDFQKLVESDGLTVSTNRVRRLLSGCGQRLKQRREQLDRAFAISSCDADDGQPMRRCA